LEFILLGFSQQGNMRRFFFERTGSAAGTVREQFIVDADMAVARRYKIAMQELPLLCRRLLDQTDATVSRTLIFSEVDMRNHAGSLAAELEARALKKKPFRRHSPPGAEQVPIAGTRG